VEQSRVNDPMFSTCRPPGEARFGGHIERLIGTQMGKLHLLPGATFSNAKEVGEYDSKRHAALTLRELERYIASTSWGSTIGRSTAALVARRLQSGGSTKVRFQFGCQRIACASG
jgi:hypothetical protein